MSSLFNTSNYSYAVARVIPGLQQIVGSITVIQNLNGAVEDIRNALLEGKSFSTLNEDIEKEQLLINNTMNGLKDFQRFNASIWRQLPILNSKTEVDIGAFSQLLLNQHADYNLSPLSGIYLATFKIHHAHCSDTPIGQYERLHWWVDLQIQATVNRLNDERESLEKKKCVPVCKRLDDIADAILTTIPVVGTLYNLPSLK